MSWQDRDYAYGGSGFYNYGNMPRARYGPAAWSITTWLIVINVAVFLLDNLLVVRTWQGDFRPIFGFGAFSAYTAIWHLQFWRFITFQFLHANLGHLFFNMLALYFFGPLVEQYLGSRRFIAFYLLCGMAGAATYLLLWMGGTFNDMPNTPLVGASAGIFGILIAAARIAPDARVMLLFPPIPMRLKTLAWVMLAIAVYTVLRNGNNAGGQAAHLGGAALGAVLMYFPQLLNIFTLRLRRPRPPRWPREFYD